MQLSANTKLSSVHNRSLVTSIHAYAARINNRVGMRVRLKNAVENRLATRGYPRGERVTTIATPVDKTSVLLMIKLFS